MEAQSAIAAGLATETKTAATATIFFIALQCLDLITTLAIFSQGGVELNPIVRALMPLTGRFFALVLSKVAVVSLILLINRRKRVLRFGNIYYSGIIVWNLCILAVLR